MHPTGSAIVRIGVQTQGQGHETTFAQIVAEELGLPRRQYHRRAWRHRYGALRPRHVRQPQHADRRRSDGCRLAQDSREGKKIAAHLLEVSADDLEWVDYKFQVKGVAEPDR